MSRRSFVIFILLSIFFLAADFQLNAQRKKQNKPKGLLSDTILTNIEFRSIGPAFTSGRIADIAIHPENESIWYVAVGSGGVWKTSNAGTTWQPIFDKEASYSIGCVTIDPNNPHIIWVGTGENVGGRHVGFGDGVYRSGDDGNSWKNMGLKESQHISKIIVHPYNSDIIWIAAQGPLWDKGGERGLYKSIDGGKNWKKTLGDEEWTGVTDIVIDPRDADILYAATWQRHRNVAAYMGGGPESGIHKSSDGGESWIKLTNGLPGSNLGKIGLAISTQKPDVIYAAIELDRRKGGLYRSEDQGNSWNKMSDAVAGGTGPHYYQELYASPHEFDKIYLVDWSMQVSEDGGKTFNRMNREHKHVDDHAIEFKTSNPDYLIVGTDGGLYETFDGEKNWRFIDNLPVTQYYKVAVDDAEPFYNIYGGTQDNNTHGGPSRTDNMHGIRNADWFITLFGDGHQPATEPGNPAIVYSEWQQGNLARIDRETGEIVYIQPQPGPDEEYERFNWDAPILVSPHKAERLYFASQRVWRSEDRGDSWTTISGDLTKDQERFKLPIMGEAKSYDNPWDVDAMSNYNTVTSLSESPKKEGLIYAGTDDGLIQVTDDGGLNWRKIEVPSLPGVPATAFVNDIKADMFDENKVYVALDNHKYGDLKPYLLMSPDKGKSWKLIIGGLPDRTLTWRIVQDHVNPELLFLATEFGIYTTIDAGNTWVKMKGGLPTISFRDLAIQRRGNDLIGASFGRGFYILDDYSFLREIDNEKLKQDGALFSIRKSWWYIERPVIGFSEKGSQGASYFTAENPDFGATFTYFLSESLKMRKEIRKEKEKKALEARDEVVFPPWEELDLEEKQEKPQIWLTVKDIEGNVIRRLKGPVSKGFHRITWDLSYPSPEALKLDFKPSEDMDDEENGMMVAPGQYTVGLSKEVDGIVTELDGPVTFKVERLRSGSLEGSSPQVTAAFWRDLDEFRRKRSALMVELSNGMSRIKTMREALARATINPGNLDAELYNLYMELVELEDDIKGNRVKRQLGEKTDPTFQDWLWAASMGTYFSTYGPTEMHKRSFEIALDKFSKVLAEAGYILNKRIPEVEQKLQSAGAPWIEGQSIPLLED